MINAFVYGLLRVRPRHGGTAHTTRDKGGLLGTLRRGLGWLNWLGLLYYIIQATHGSKLRHLRRLGNARAGIRFTDSDPACPTLVRGRGSWWRGRLHALPAAGDEGGDQLFVPGFGLGGSEWPHPVFAAVDEDPAVAGSLVEAYLGELAKPAACHGRALSERVPNRAKPG